MNDRMNNGVKWEGGGGFMSTVGLNELLEHAGRLAAKELTGKKRMPAMCTLVDATGEHTVIRVDTDDRYNNIAALLPSAS